MVAVAKTSWPATRNGSRELLLDPLGDDFRTSDIWHVIHEDCELIAPDASDGVVTAHGGFQSPRHGDQHLISGSMAETVVDDLEAVEVEDITENRRIPRRRAPQGPVESRCERGAVREARQGIVRGVVLQPLLGRLPLRDVLVATTTPIGSGPRKQEALRLNQRRPSSVLQAYSSETRCCRLDITSAMPVATSRASSTPRSEACEQVAR